MVMEKTEQELREETLARRARHDLKNQPLPMHKVRMGISQAPRQTQSASLTDLYDKDLFRHSASNRKTLNSLSSARTLTSLAHSRSMQDLSDKASTDSCGLKRSKSYSRITEQQSAYEQDRASYKSSLSSMYTNTSAFSSRSIAAIRQDDRPVIMAPSTVLHLSRLQDPQLKDPCWRARRATSGKQEVEKQYKWPSRLGIDRETSHTDINPRLLCRSTPDMTKLGSSQTGRTSIPLPVLVPSHSSGRGDGLTGLSFKTSSLKSTAASSSSLSTGGGDYMDKTLRQLKVATDWLASLASRPQSDGAEVTESRLPRTPAWKRPATSSCRPSLSSCAARWSTQGSQRRFEGMRERFV